MVSGPSVFPSREPGVSGNFWWSHESCQVLFRTSGRKLEIPLRRHSGQEAHLAKTMEPRGFPRVAAGFSSYDGDLSLPLGLALGSPIFPSSARETGGCARVTAGPKRPHLGVCPGTNIPLQGSQGSRGCIPLNHKTETNISIRSETQNRILETSITDFPQPISSSTTRLPCSLCSCSWF